MALRSFEHRPKAADRAPFDDAQSSSNVSAERRLLRTNALAHAYVRSRSGSWRASRARAVGGTFSFAKSLSTLLLPVGADACP